MVLNLSKQVYLHVEGPVCVAGATTRDKIYEDNANRSFLIQIDEIPAHERQVLEYQGRLAAGLINFKRYEENINVLKACQLLIEPIEVIIPFALKLELPPHVSKKMRTKNHYLTLIKSITFWNQHQRKRVSDRNGNTFLLYTLEDVEWANYLSRDVLLRKSDELSGKTRQFFESPKEYIREQKTKTFYAKDTRRHFRMHPMELQRRLNELEARGLIRCVSRSNKPGNEHYFTEYLQDGRNFLLTRNQSGTEFFFINQFGSDCSDQALSARLDRLVKNSGSPGLQSKKPSLHTLRHSIATHLLQSGMEIELIQKFLGHASLESTQIYTHLSAEMQ